MLSWKVRVEDAGDLVELSIDEEGNLIIDSDAGLPLTVEPDELRRGIALANSEFDEVVR